jgi:hypothetical protein
MANIILHQVGTVTVGLDGKDGYVNVTALCAAYNAQKGATKKPSDWLRGKRAKEYIAYVATVGGIPETELVEIRQGAGFEEQGTWVHPDLADPFSSWLSVEYEFFVSKWLQDWRSGNLAQSPEPAQPSLPPHKEAQAVAESIVYIHEHMAKVDVRLAQILIDRAMQTVQPVALLPGTTTRMEGAVRIAQLLGFKVGKEQATLGRAVAQAWRAAGKGDPQTANREVGGAMRDVKVYPSDDPIVTDAIRGYYQARNIA